MAKKPSFFGATPVNSTTTPPRSLEEVLRSTKTGLEEAVEHYQLQAEKLKPARTGHDKRMQMQHLAARQDYQLQVDVLDQVLAEWEQAKAGENGSA